jgi:FkbM family methyltransferase
VPATKTPPVLEIGRNHGTATAWLLEMVANPRIYCFEPDPRAIARFKERVGERPNVTLFELALSDREGSVDFYQSGGLPNELLMESMPQGWDLSGSIKQPFRHLATHPWVIWMDVQGAEMEVLRGAAKTLPRTRVLCTEYNNRELYKGQPSLRLLVSYLADFSAVVRYPDDVLLRNNTLGGTPSRGSHRRRSHA